MKISAVNKCNYSYVQTNKARRNTKNVIAENKKEQIAFKSNKGALIGMFGGAATGLGALVLTSLTSGLIIGAAIAGISVQVGACVGSYVEDKLVQKHKVSKKQKIHKT